MHKYSVVLVSVLALAGVGLAGCHKNNSQPPPGQRPSPTQQMKQGAQQVGQGVKGAATAAGAYASDAAITSHVKARLAANQGLSSFQIHVTTNNGVVTLSGTVDLASQRDTAARIAANTAGVKGVNDNITVREGNG